MGSVYFIQSPDGEFVKIGYTAGPVMVRFKQIGSLQPGLKVLGYIPGTRQTEAWLHEKFVALRSTGEWFAQTPGLQKFIAQLGLLEGRVIHPSRRRCHPLQPGDRNPDRLLTASDIGRRGGAARAKVLSAETRKEIARLGGLASGAKRKQNGNGSKGKADV